MRQVVHVLNRGVDKRKLFLDEQDYLRFIHDLFEFNDQERTVASSYFFRKSFDLGGRKINLKSRRPRKLLVRILAFCLMPNHYHLLLISHIEQGIPRFMQKVNAGYVKYFNEKYKRRGTLFEGGYKSIVITNDAHFIHIPYYIHLNPLDLKFPEWRKREIKNHKEAMKFLESYRWSSFQDYIGKQNFPSVIDRDFLLKFFNGPAAHKKEVLRWLKDLDLEALNKSILE